MFLTIGGQVAANLASVAAIAAGVALAGWVAPAGRAWLVIVTLCGLPMLLCNSGVAIDFGFDFAAGMAALWAALHAARRSGTLPRPYLSIAVVTLILLRPDNVLFAAAVLLALPSGTDRRRALLAGAIAATLCAAAYIELVGLHTLLHGVVAHGSPLARLARAAMLGTAAFGPGGLLSRALLTNYRISGLGVATLAIAAPL